MVILWSGKVPVDATDIVTARLERVARRATRQGFPVPRIVFGHRETLPVPGTSTSMEWVFIQMVADGALRLGDWTFLGTVSTLEDGAAFVTWVPGVERIEWSGQVNYCDHCRTNRDRNNTYLVSNDAGFYHQVGSTCIKDFTGHSPASIVGWLGALNEISFSDDEIESWGRSATRFYSPSEIIGVAARIVSKAGYVSKQKAEDEDMQATAEIVREVVSRSMPTREFDSRYPVTPESEALYFATMDAIEAAVGQPAGSDWLADIVRLGSSTGVQWRHIGILGSAVILGLRQQERAAMSDRPESNFFGEIGQRLTLTNVKVVMKRSFEGAYGQSFVLRFDVDGNDAVWFASWSEASNALSEGDIITIVATVKAHELDSRSSRPTTVLTRCTIKEV